MTEEPSQAPIAVSRVMVGEQEEKLVLEVLRSGQIAQGRMVEALEAQFAEAVGVGHAVAVSNGTAALFLALESLSLEPGDEVITSPFTFMATLNAILATGATARFADIGDDFNVDPDSVAALVNSRTRAIMPVHLYGCGADMPAISHIAAANELVLVEDAAQAIGASVADRPCGSWGIGCFSLYATKNVTTGEGGVVTTNDATVADRVRISRNQGMKARYEYVMAGFNMRMTDLQAAIGIPQMERLADITAARRANASALGEHLAGLRGARLPVEPDGRHHVFHQYTIQLDESRAPRRDEIVAAMVERGVRPGIYYPKLVTDYDYLSGHPQIGFDDVPRARRAAQSVISLPVHPGLDETSIARVASVAREVIDG